MDRLYGQLFVPFTAVRLTHPFFGRNKWTNVNSIIDGISYMTLRHAILLPDEYQNLQIDRIVA